MEGGGDELAAIEQIATSKITSQGIFSDDDVFFITFWIQI